MKWALVLSGGGVKGLAYIGMLKAFNHLGFPKPDCIVGCSMGAIIGGLYASGMKINEMENFFSDDFHLSDYTEMPRIAMSHKKIAKLFQLGTSINNLISGLGIDSGEKALTLFRRLSCYQRFEQCSIPFFCNAVDICSGKEEIFEEGFLADGMRASSSYPGFFAPFYHKGKLFVDGCVKNNTPVWIAKQKGYKNIFAVTLGMFKKKQPKDIYSSVSVIMRCMEVASGMPQHDKRNIPTCILDMDTNTSVYDFSGPQQEILRGYTQTIDNRDMLNLFFKCGFTGLIERKKMSIKTSEMFKNERVF